MIRSWKRNARRALTAGATIALLCTLAVPVRALAPGTFESSDGNLVVDNAANEDWGNAPHLAVALDKPTGQNDDSFGTGTKEDTAVPSVVAGSIPNNKSDLTRFYVSNEKVAGKDFLYLAWERVQEPTGTTNMDFEFNQSKTLSANGVTPVRTAGDVLIKYDLSQGGTNPVLGYHRWVTKASALADPTVADTPAGACEAANSFPCWGKVQPLSGANFDGSINSDVVTDPVSPDPGRTLSARTFGEAGINLTDSGIFPAGQCESFGKAYLKSRSSDSFTAAVKDFVAPIDVNVSNCGGITIRKDTVPDDAQNFSFTTTSTGSTLSPSSFTLDDDADPTLPNFVTYAAIQQGTYTFTEGTATGFDLTAITCTISGTGGTTYTPSLGTRTLSISLKPLDSADCTFTNTKRGTITIIKDTVPNDPTDFAFAVGGANPSALSGFSLDDDSDPTLSNTQTFTNVKPGAYTVTETDPTPGFDLTGLTCTPSGTGTSSSTDLASRQASITLGAGGSVTCTYTNTKRGTITIVKDAVPDDPTDFTYSVGGANPSALTGFSLDDDSDPTLSNTQTFTNVKPGAYTFTETDPGAGFDLTNIICTPTGTGTSSSVDISNRQASVTLGAGGSVTCTYTNSKRGTITIVKDAVPDGPTDFAYTVGGTNPSGLTGFSLDDDNDPTLSNTQTFTNVKPGSYTFTEADPTPGFDLTGLSCVVSGTGTSSTTDQANRLASITLGTGGSATCTYTNTQRGTITIVKDAVPDGPTDFAFTVGGGNPSALAGFSLDDDNDPTLSNTQVFNNVKPGTYTFTETDPTPGFDLTDVTCVKTGGTTSTSKSVLNRRASITLGAGGSATCTFTNTQRGTIVIVKNAVPDGATDFAFTADATLSPSSFSLDDDNDPTLSNMQTYNNVTPGSYTVTEAPNGPNFDLTQLDCVSTPGSSGAQDGLQPRQANISLAPGGTVTCTFTNRQRASISVHKTDDANNALAGAVFTLYNDNAPTGGAKPGVEDTSTGTTCTTNANGNCSFDNVLPGAYWIVETTTPSGYATADPQQVSVTAGQSTGLTFADPRLFKVVVVVCQESNGQLYGSQVDFGGGNVQTLSHGDVAQAVEDAICGTADGALSDVQKGDHGATVHIPNQAL